MKFEDLLLDDNFAKLNANELVADLDATNFRTPRYYQRMDIQWWVHIGG